jgi:carboxyl-terminal processing protease
MIGRMLVICVGLCLLGQAAIIAPAKAEPRVALVIGNSHYGGDIGTLPNPVNDAGLISQALQQAGFQVIKVTDADQKKMKRAIADFGDKLAAAGPTATGLFFYAGHGLQVQGINYLIPVGAEITKEADVDIEAVATDKVLDQMTFAGSRVNIVVLDACRNNPLARSFRSMSRGLAPINAAQGTFVAYSTAPGSVAADGSGTDSPYSVALAKSLVQPGIGIEDAFRNVRTQVMDATGGKQVPWDSSSLTAPFYFKPAAAQFTTAAQPAAAAAPVNTALEQTFWQSIQNSKQASDYQAYLAQFPNGTFAGLARSRLASLSEGAPRQQPVAPPSAIQAPVSAPTKPAAVQATPAPAPAPVEDTSSETSSDVAPAVPPTDICKTHDDTIQDYVDKCRRQRVGSKHH